MCVHINIQTGFDGACPNPPGYCLGPLCDAASNGYAFLPYNGTTRLFCFLNQNPKQRFSSDPNKYIAAADANWPKELQSENTQYCFNTDYFNSNC